MLPPTDRLKFGVYRSGNERSRKIAGNIVLSVLFRGGSVLLNLLLVPITIRFINPINYGVWIAISSVLTWIAFFDVGIGNGLRNKLSASLAVGTREESKVYVSSAYAAFGLLSVVVCVAVILINPLIDWRNFLGIPAQVSGDVHKVILVALCFSCAQFVLQLINPVLYASHKPSLVNFVILCGQAATLVAVLVAAMNGRGNLVTITWITMGATTVALLVSNIYFFSNRFREIRPAISFVDWGSLRVIIRLGLSFFFVQTGALILFQTSNIVISRYLGPAEVTVFNVAYRLFSIVMFGFALLLTPFWSAFTDAYAKKDFGWIRKNLGRTRKWWLLLSCTVVPLLLLMSGRIYRVWIGDAVVVPFSVSAALALYAVAYTGMAVNTYFLNGIGRIGLQKYLYLVVCVVNVPLSIYLSKWYGVAGAIAANTFLMAIMLIALWGQANQILKKEIDINI